MMEQKNNSTAMQQYTIHLERLAVQARHGVLPQERVVGAVFYISLDAEILVGQDAYAHDQLHGTVSYADIVETVRKEMAQPANLLEHLAYRIGQRLLDDYPAIHSLKLRIDKENPPCGACVDNIGVSLRLSK